MSPLRVLSTSLEALASVDMTRFPSFLGRGRGRGVWIILLFLFCCLHKAEPQNNAGSNLIDRFFAGRQQFQDDFRSFSDSIDLEFADYIEKNWKEFKVEPPLKLPYKPESKEMPVYTPNDTSVETGRAPSLQVDTVEIEPVSRKEGMQVVEGNANALVIDFFGTPLTFDPVKKDEIKLTGIGGKQIADFWRQLSKTDYSAFINDLNQKKIRLGLGSWGIYQLILEWANANFPKQQENEKVMFIVALLNKAGYKVKAGQVKNALVVLMAFDNAIYGKPFVRFDDGCYYILSNQTATEPNVSSYNLNYGRASLNFDLNVQILPKLEEAAHLVKRTFRDKVYLFKYNNNLTDYYETFPLTELKIYGNTPLSTLAEKSIMSTFAQDLQNKNVTEKLKFLLSFFQYALGYKTDGDQFGYDRCFFGEETLLHPYSDCQDRAILFCRMVKLLCGLQTLLIDYPTHVATAVKLNEPTGDAIVYNNERYIVCDPTYVGAPIGKTMGGHDNAKAKIVAVR